MRSNLPITQREYPFPPGQSLVSVTDLKGRIVYCNPAFASVSGFSRSELLGQPHNLVRHPEMPSEAFRDMWASIQAGQPWSALVKNRRKDGDHYWVVANATPMTEGERITGFLSVRTAPTREQVAQAEALYARMNEEARSGHATIGLQRGRLVRLDLPGRLLQRLRGLPALLGAEGALALAALLAAATLASASPASVWLPGASLLFVAAQLIGRRFAHARLQRVVVDALHLAAGDLAHEVRTGESGQIGDLQRALVQLAVNLRTVIGDVRTEVESVRGAVSEIAAGNQDLSSRTEAQASSLEQTAASMEQINATVRQSAASATQGAQLASQATQVAEHSHSGVLGVVQAMDGINDSARRIGEIIHVIEGVAFQTNILALNAAVEAARAGDAGRGFAVVASEVRSLAQRTSGAAREIKQLITESSERAAAGTRLTQDARGRMQEALQAVASVNTVLSEISTAAVEQQGGVAQVNSAVTHLDGITQQNAALVEQLAAAAQSLNGQVKEVTDSMRLFRLHVGETTITETDAVALRRANASADLALAEAA